ncbi:MAG: hypothetical protein M1469_09380 [Bacteroidetes bacterium]|nr:hypothetical protein [Bacteroidota bacterium]
MRAVERAIRLVVSEHPSLGVKAICDEEGIEVRHDEMGGAYFGLYTNLYGKAVINVRPDLNVQENLEVISHELYHHFSLRLSENPLPHNLIMEKRCASPFLRFYMRKEEHEADLFAAFFLCPDVSDCETYHDIMRKYNRSKQVAKLRMVAEQMIIYGGGENGLSEKKG